MGLAFHTPYMCLGFALSFAYLYFHFGFAVGAVAGVVENPWDTAV